MATNSNISGISYVTAPNNSSLFTTGSINSADLVFSIPSSWEQYLTNDELKEILIKIRNRASEDEFCLIFSNILASVYFPDDFLMEFIDEENVSQYLKILKNKYKREILTGAYPRLSLLINLKE